MSSTFFLISGPSGAGKNSIISEVVKQHANIRFAPSLTTRSMRQGESEGAPYHFVSAADFRARIDSGDILEFVEVHGNLYGTSKATINGLLDQGFDVITDIEVIGAQVIRSRMPGRTCGVFVTVDSDAELARRIVGRHPESPESVARRIARAQLEKQVVSGFDYRIDNIDLAASVALLSCIVRAHKARVSSAEPAGGALRGKLHRTCEFELSPAYRAALGLDVPELLRTYEGPQETPHSSLRRLLITQHLLQGRSDASLPAFCLVATPVAGGEPLCGLDEEICSSYRVVAAE